MARNLIKYQNMEQFENEQGNQFSVDSIIPGVAYVKDGSMPGPEIVNDSVVAGASSQAPDGSAVFYNEEMVIDPGFQGGL